MSDQTTPEPNTGEPIPDAGNAEASGVKPLWWIVGGAAGVVALLAFCCCGGVMIYWFSGGGGEHPARLVGTWKGGGKFMMVEATATLEFRSNGRVEIERHYGGLGALSGGGTASANWAVEQVDGEKYVLKVVPDTDPENPIGWSITFDGDDKFSIVGFDDMAYTFERQ